MVLMLFALASLMLMLRMLASASAECLWQSKHIFMPGAQFWSVQSRLFTARNVQRSVTEV
jgi:hypothetical protein